MKKAIEISNFILVICIIASVILFLAYILRLTRLELPFIVSGLGIIFSVGLIILIRKNKEYARRLNNSFLELEKNKQFNISFVYYMCLVLLVLLLCSFYRFRVASDYYAEVPRNMLIIGGFFIVAFLVQYHRGLWIAIKRDFGRLKKN